MYTKYWKNIFFYGKKKILRRNEQLATNIPHLDESGWTILSALEGLCRGGLECNIV